MDRHLAERYDLTALAAHFHLSSRTLLRKYRTETAETPLAYLQQARMRKARHLLENTTYTLTEIAATVGYRDASTFNTVFERHTGIRPTPYRHRFNHAED